MPTDQTFCSHLLYIRHVVEIVVVRDTHGSHRRVDKMFRMYDATIVAKVGPRSVILTGSIDKYQCSLIVSLL